MKYDLYIKTTNPYKNKTSMIKKTWLLLLLCLFKPAFTQQAAVDNDVRTVLVQSRKTSVLIKLRYPSLSKSIDGNREQQILQIQNSILSTLSKQDFQLAYQYKTIPGFSGTLSANGLQKLENHPDVESIQSDLSGHGGLLESVPAIDADEAHNSDFTGDGVVIGVLDSGVNFNHPDLSKDIIHQYHFLNQGEDADSGAFDYQGHGTNVTGIITSDGDVAPVGVAPGAKIVAIQVLDESGRGWVSDWIAGVDYIVHHNGLLHVQIINMSLVTDVLYSDTNCDSRISLFAAAVDMAKTVGITIFACSGNQGSTKGMNAPACLSDVAAVGAVYDSDLGREPDTGTYYSWIGGYWPDKYDSTTSIQTLTCFTNRNTCLDFVAPGAPITSTGLNNGTSTYRGTSQASPHAAGVAALMLQKKPSLRPDEILNILKNSGALVHDPETGLDFPLLNAITALDAIKTTADPVTISLEQNYPNPFNRITTIPFTIPEYSFVTIKIFNMMGEEVAVPFSGYLLPDQYDMVWDAGEFSSGLYFFCLKKDNYTETKKMILIK